MKYLVLFALLLNSVAFSQNNKLEVIYKVNVSNDNLDDADPSIRSEIRNIYQAAENIEFVLKILNDKTHFKMKHGMMPDNNKYLEQAIVHAGGNYEYYQDPDIKLKHGDVFGEEMSIILERDKYTNWQISKEQKNILGYRCFKATTSYLSFDKNENEITVDVYAWFTPEIPVSAGPFDIDGLPGLILEASKNERFTYIASDIEFIENDLSIEKPKAKKTITTEEQDVIVKKVLKMIRERG